MEPFLLTYPDRNGSTPLHHASIQRDLKCIKLLFGFKAPKKSNIKKVDVNAQNDYKRTPLHCAVAYSQFEAVDILLKKNACIDLEDNDGKTPVDYARELTNAQGRAEMLRILNGN